MAHLLPSGYKFCELYECRGTTLIGSREQVKVHKVILRALARSRYKLLQICQVSSSKSKNHDKPINYTVRVRFSCLFLNCQVSRDLSIIEKSSLMRYESIVSYFRPVSHRVTNDVEVTMSDIYVVFC